MKMSVWEFVETYHKNYHSDWDVYMCNRISKLVEKIEVHGDITKLELDEYDNELIEKHFGGKIDVEAIYNSYNKFHSRVYESTIANFIKNNVVELPVIIMNNKFRVVQK